MLTKTWQGLSECQGSLRKLKRAWKRPAQKVGSRKGWDGKSERENKKMYKRYKNGRTDWGNVTVSLQQTNKYKRIFHLTYWEKSMATPHPKAIKIFFPARRLGEIRGVGSPCCRGGRETSHQPWIQACPQNRSFKGNFSIYDLWISGGVIWKVHDALGMDQGQKNGYAIGW